MKISQVSSTTSTHRIRSDQRERVRSERGRPDKRARKSQIREGEKEIARPRARATQVARPGLRDPGRSACVVKPRSRGVAQPRSRSLGHVTQAAGLTQPRSCEPGFISSSWSFFFSFWLWFLFLLVLFCYIWALNRVFKTRFSSGRHVENDVTSDVIRPWKSSLKVSIYGSKSSLLYSIC